MIRAIIKKQLILSTVILIIILSCAGSGNPGQSSKDNPGADNPPEWTTSHPTSKLYYIGIAFTEKNNTDYMQIAQNTALNNLASQIAVEISGQIDQVIIERSGIIEDEFKRHISASTRAELEGYELVGIWEDNRNYWVYYRLNKTLYAEQKQQKLTEAVILSLDLFNKAVTNETQNNIAKALQFYIQALNPIEKYLGEPLEVSYKGSSIYLYNEIYASIQNLLSRIELKPDDNKVNARVGQPLKKPLQLTAVYKSSDSKTVGIAGLPLSISFVRGDGDLVDKIITDDNGTAFCRVSKIKAVDKIQLIQTAIDISSLVNIENTPVIVRKIVEGLTIPAVQIELNVSGITAYISSTETHFAGKLDVLSIEPELKKGLSENGFSFVDSKQDADYIITIKALSRQGSEIMGGMYSSFVDVSIFVYDNTAGNELYKRSLHNIKGIDLNFDKAGRKAFTNAGKQVRNEIVYDLLETIQR